MKREKQAERIFSAEKEQSVTSVCAMSATDCIHLQQEEYNQKVQLLMEVKMDGLIRKNFLSGHAISFNIQIHLLREK